MPDEARRPKRIPKKKTRRSVGSAGASPAPFRPGSSDQPNADQSRAEDARPAATEPTKTEAAEISKATGPKPQGPQPQATTAIKSVVETRLTELTPQVRPEVRGQPKPNRNRINAVGPTVAADAVDRDEGWLVRLHQSLWTMPAWLLSLLVHVIVFMTLALVTAVVIEREPEVIISTSITGEEDPLEDFSEIEMEETDELIEDEPLFQPDMPEMPKLSFDESLIAPSSTVSATATTESSVGSAAAVAEMADTAGSPKTGSDVGKAVSFYGSKAKGNRFVFLIDNSPNMNNEGRMLMAFDQLLRAVNQMSRKQMFSVVFYSNRAYTLFFPESETELVEATRRNKDKLREWLTTVELCDSRPRGGDAIEESLKIAHDLQPSTVFFLTDGDYAKKVATVLRERPLGTPLNVIGLMPSNPNNKAGREQMAKLQVFAELADAHNGLFTGVPSTPGFPDDTLVERRRDAPGPVWGKY